MDGEVAMGVWAIDIARRSDDRMKPPAEGMASRYCTAGGGGKRVTGEIARRQEMKSIPTRRMEPSSMYETQGNTGEETDDVSLQWRRYGGGGHFESVNTRQPEGRPNGRKALARQQSDEDARRRRRSQRGLSPRAVVRGQAGKVIVAVVAASQVVFLW